MSASGSYLPAFLLLQPVRDTVKTRTGICESFLLIDFKKTNVCKLLKIISIRQRHFSPLIIPPSCVRKQTIMREVLNNVTFCVHQNILLFLFSSCAISKGICAVEEHETHFTSHN